MINEKLTICFLGNASASHTIKWARYFSEKGHNVHLLSFDLPETDDLRGIKMHILKRKIPTITNSYNTFINLLFSLNKTRKIIKEINPDIVNAHYISSYGTLAFLAGFRPLVFTAWGSDILVNPKRNLAIKIFTQYILKKADLITCDAEHMVKAMVNLGASESKIKIINFGIDTKKFSPGAPNEKIRKELDLYNKKIVISLKWSDPLSDIETLIKAAYIVIGREPEARFLIIGPSSFPEHFEKLKNMVKDLKITKEVKFLGLIPYEKIPEYLNLSDVYVCTSLSDAGLASSTAEAMACELPVIITDFGDNGKWVENEKNGFLIPLKDYNMLAEKIIYLFDNHDIGKKFGELSRKIIGEKNDYYREMEKMENIYKGLIQKRKYQICTKCIMDTSDPEITFDKNGVCNHCKRFAGQSQYLYTEEDLKKVVEKIKRDGKGKKYDCVMGLSGGVDSCMTAYLAKKYGLRPLAIHVDNGWNAEISQSNLERMLRQLDIDLYTHVIDWEEFKDLQISFLKASVPSPDSPYDHAILGLFFKMARKLGVKYIVHGGNDRTEFIMPKEWGYNSWDYRHLRAIHKKFGKIKRLKTYPSVSIWKLFYYLSVKKIRNFRILDYINYNKNESKEFLKKNFGWQDYGEKHCESIYTRFISGYILPKKFGFNRNRAWLSCLVLSGQMTREEALKEVERSFYSSEEEMERDKNYIIKKLGLKDEEFEKIMALPVKSYRDYPNNSFFLNRNGLFIKLARKILRKV